MQIDAYYWISLKHILMYKFMIIYYWLMLITKNEICDWKKINFIGTFAKDVKPVQFKIGKMLFSIKKI